MEMETQKERKIRWAGLPAKLVFFVCDAMIRKRQKAKWIVHEVRERFGEKLARTQVNEVFYEGLRRGYFQPTPPRDEWLVQRMLDVFGGGVPRSADANGETPTSGASIAPRNQRKNKNVKVVCQGSDVSLLPVATAAAEVTLEVIMAIHKKLTAAAERRPGAGKDQPVPVHIGFGGGASMNLVARYLAERLRWQENPPPLVIHALTSGFNVREPDNAPGSFFSFFQSTRVVSFRGLFAPAYVMADDWDKTRQLVGVRESFGEKNDLHVIVTALASRQDDHGELNSVMRLGGEVGEQTRRILDDEEKRIGDVLYRPFAAHGPITRQAGIIRAVTLFELPELVTFAAEENKAVILVAGPCAGQGCRRSRSDALLPLLREPSLDVWSHLVTDERTALECLP